MRAEQRKRAVAGYCVHVPSTMAARGSSSARTPATSATGSGSPPTASGAPETTAIATSSGRIRVGVGGWVYEPWRDNFYPAGLASQPRELEYLSRRVTAIEINATYYRTQKPRPASPSGAMRRPTTSSSPSRRRATPRIGACWARPENRSSASSGAGSPSSDRSSDRSSGSSRRRSNSTPTTSLPSCAAAGASGGTPLRHVSKSATRASPAEYVALARRHGVATVFADSDEYPSFADVTADFVYARLMRCESSCETGYRRNDRRLGRARTRMARRPRGPAFRASRRGAPAPPRDVFLFFISGAKERAPAAAVATRGARRRRDPALIARRRSKGLAACAGEAFRKGAVPMRRDCGRTGTWRRRG